MKLVYNFLNLLSKVKTTGGALKAKYSYLSDGTKLGVRDNNEVNGFDYLGSLTYKKSSAGMQLESVHFGDGVILVTSSNNSQEINYFLADHLGSVRVIDDGNGVVKERNDYYPLGVRHSRNDYLTSDNRYKYNGKEEQVTDDVNYLDYGARMYDSGLGKWFNVDPASENYISWSVYNYTLCNPIIYIDPNGMDTWIVNPMGYITFWDNDHEDTIYAVDNDWNIIKKMRVTARDQSILNQLLEELKISVANPYVFMGNRDLNYALGDEKNQNELLKIFLFLAENTNVEWRLDRYMENGTNKYSLATIHDHSFSPSAEWCGHSTKSTIALLHSHPNVSNNKTLELASMGWESGLVSKDSDADLKYNNDNYHSVYYYTYFPKSKKLWSLNKYGPPSVIRTGINSYKRFLFGTINTK